VVDKGLWLSGQMFFFAFSNLSDEKLGQVSIDIINCECFESVWILYVAQWYWKLFKMGTIGMTFLGKVSSIMSCKLTCF
jgi:hypothetical protein